MRTDLVRTEEYYQGGTNSAVCFGECRNSTDTSGTDKLFTGQRLDTTGLYYYNARYYDPTIGRFISADTYVQDYTNPQTLNRYSYCLNNPTKYNDPTGHVLPLLAAMGVGALIGAIVNSVIYAATNQDNFSWNELGAAALSGAITGAVAVIAGPIAGTVIKAAGGVASTLNVMAGATAVNFLGGGFAYSAEEGIEAIETGSYEWDMGEAASRGLTNAAAGAFTMAVLPTNGMSTINQSNYFTPRTINGFLNPGKNATAIELGTLTGTTGDWGLQSIFSGELAPTSQSSNPSSGPSYWDTTYADYGFNYYGG